MNLIDISPCAHSNKFMKTIAIIPARAGSKGLPDKNLRSLYGKPLIKYTIDSALACPFFDKVVVTTDSPMILEIANGGCDTLLRPARLAMDDTPLAPVIANALIEIEKRYQTQYHVVFTLQPTSPLRNSKDITSAWNIFNSTKADSLISVVEENHSLWHFSNGSIVSFYRPRVNRQKAIPYFMGNGAIFITKRNVLLRHKDRLGGKVAIYVMNKRNSVDIHYLEDLELAEWYLEKGVV